MTQEEKDERIAANCGLSVAEYQRRRDELLRQVADLKSREGK